MSSCLNTGFCTSLFLPSTVIIPMRNLRSCTIKLFYMVWDKSLVHHVCRFDLLVWCGDEKRLVFDLSLTDLKVNSTLSQLKNPEFIYQHSLGPSNLNPGWPASAGVLELWNHQTSFCNRHVLEVEPFSSLTG
jgi:hypothetical protein